MVSWFDQSTSNKELCDEIDEIMKQEQEDVILLDEALAAGTALDPDLDSFSDLLGNPSSLSSSAAAVSPMSPSTGNNTGYTSPRNVYELPPTSCPTYAVNNSQSKSTTGSYSSLGISPKFTTLSIHQHHHHPYSPPAQETNHSSTLFPKFTPSPVSINSKNNLHPPPYVQQQDNTGLGPPYNFDLPMSNGPSDVKRFRSASMNEGATQQQQARIGRDLLRREAEKDHLDFRSSSVGSLSKPVRDLCRAFLLSKPSPFIDQHNDHHYFVCLIDIHRYLVERCMAICG